MNEKQRLVFIFQMVFGCKQVQTLFSVMHSHNPNNLTGFQSVSARFIQPSFLPADF